MIYGDGTVDGFDDNGDGDADDTSGDRDDDSSVVAVASPQSVVDTCVLRDGTRKSSGSLSLSLP